MNNNLSSDSLLEELNYELDRTWNGGFKAVLDFTLSETISEGWEIDFTALYSIREIYGANIVEHQGNNYTIGHVDWNQTVNADRPQSIVIIADYLDNPSTQATNFEFTSLSDIPPNDGNGNDVPSPDESTPEPFDDDRITRPSYNQSEGFFTLDGKLYDANGVEFVPRGVNNLHVWYDDNNDNINQAYDALDNIASFGFNSVRIVWEVDFLGRPTNDSMLEQIIQRTINLNMVPMVSIQDYTGSTDSSALLDRGVKWWTDRADLWEKYEKYLIIDVANEFGNYTMAHEEDRRAFPNIYKEAITRMRNAGIDNTLVIEPFDWAKDYTLIKDFGQEIYNHDPQKNVMFSPHIYCGEGESSTTIRDMFDSLTGEEIPFLVGEFAHEHPTPWLGGGECNVQEQTILSEAQQHGVGHFAWAWYNSEFSIASNWEANSKNELTSWGQDLVFEDPNGISATSEVASIFQ